MYFSDFLVIKVYLLLQEMTDKLYVILKLLPDDESRIQVFKRCYFVN